jgi:hypothetical protein
MCWKPKFKEFETHIVEFFASQFDSMRPDETETIQDGLVENSENIYIYIASLNNLKPIYPTSMIARFATKSHEICTHT